MKIVLTGGRKGQTVDLFSFRFINGVCEIPESLVEKASKTVCRFYSAELVSKETVKEEPAPVEENVEEKPVVRRGRPPKAE